MCLVAQGDLKCTIYNLGFTVSGHSFDSPVYPIPLAFYLCALRFFHYQTSHRDRQPIYEAGVKDIQKIFFMIPEIFLFS